MINCVQVAVPGARSTVAVPCLPAGRGGDRGRGGPSTGGQRLSSYTLYNVYLGLQLYIVYLGLQLYNVYLG